MQLFSFKGIRDKLYDSVSLTKLRSMIMDTFNHVKEIQ